MIDDFSQDEDGSEAEFSGNEIVDMSEGEILDSDVDDRDDPHEETDIAMGSQET